MNLKNELQVGVKALAAANVFIGTSSWKYPGWCGLLYDERRYITRGKFSKARFEESCLEEYAEVFKTVCVDAGYYKFPDEKYLEKLVTKVPEDFKFAFKVTDEITIKQFPSLPRHGMRAGKLNENFLNADLFARAFLRPCEAFKNNVGILMFEFSQFHLRDFKHGRDFVTALDEFLSRLPKGWQYGVEIRNKHFLEPEYFEMLASHNVTHVFNSWSRMPPVSDQLKIEGSRTSDFLAARFLLTPGNIYDKAVKDFSPYTETKAVDENARAAGKTLIEMAKKLKKLPSYIFINNRLEGNALFTIMALLSMERPPKSPSPAITVAPTIQYPSYWTSSIAVMDSRSIPVMAYKALFELSEKIARNTYTKESALFDIRTQGEIHQHCIEIVAKAAHEFAEKRYGIIRSVPDSDSIVVSEIESTLGTDVYGINSESDQYDIFLPGAEQITGNDVESEKVFVSTTGIRVWLLEEEHPEQ